MPRLRLPARRPAPRTTDAPPTALRPSRPHAPARVALALAVVVAVALAACGGESAPVARDTVGAAPPVTIGGATATEAALGWEPEIAGPVLLVGGTEPTSAAVVFPALTDSTFTDSTTFALEPLGGQPVELFARPGLVGRAQVPTAAPTAPEGEACLAWPSVPLPGATTGWLVGFVAGRATGIPLDSIERLASSDSAQLAAEAARLASRIPSDTAVAFNGLPFVVRTAYRFTAAPGVDALVADVVRRIAQEANPREQHVLLVAERPAGQRGARYRLVYHARTSGAEDAVETREVLAAVKLGSAGTPTLVLGLTYYEGSAFMLVERTGDGTWRERWSSAYAGC